MPDAPRPSAALALPPAVVWQHWQPLSCVVVRGADRLAHLHRLCSQDLRPLATPGRSAHALCLTAQGRLVDWVRVVALPGALYLATSPGRAAVVADWIERYTITEDVTARVADGEISRLLLVGPGAASAAAAVAGADLAPSPTAGHASLTAAASTADPAVGLAPGVRVWQLPLPAWGPGLEAWLPQAEAAACGVALAAAGAAKFSDSDLEGRRLAAGIPGPAGEYPDAVNPLELRLTASSVGWNSGCYIGQEVISRLENYRKVARLLVGIVARLPAGAQLAAPVRIGAGGQPIGRLTSWQVVDDRLTALAVVKQAAAVPQPVELLSGAERLPASLTLPPFCVAA